MRLRRPPCPEPGNLKWTKNRAWRAPCHGADSRRMSSLLMQHLMALSNSASSSKMESINSACLRLLLMKRCRQNVLHRDLLSEMVFHSMSRVPASTADPWSLRARSVSMSVSCRSPFDIRSTQALASLATSYMSARASSSRKLAHSGSASVYMKRRNARTSTSAAFRIVTVRVWPSSKLSLLNMASSTGEALASTARWHWKQMDGAPSTTTAASANLWDSHSLAVYDRSACGGCSRLPWHARLTVKCTPPSLSSQPCAAMACQKSPWPPSGLATMRSCQPRSCRPPCWKVCVSVLHLSFAPEWFTTLMLYLASSTLQSPAHVTSGMISTNAARYKASP
mmetsp:Transcript_120007/g.340207  ORF Transcript_120007/g.340207 Transcript_120007/m.340207 type:complete len:338 (+) Transcript_120007:113-1126(+)